jgi:carboxylesterase type B
MEDQPVARPLPTHRTTQTQNKRTQTYMTRVGFEPTTTVFEGTKAVHALDRAATVIGSRCDQK